MLKRIKIKGYKSFKDFALELTPLTVIFGPNASGKSNFLDAIYLLSRAVKSKNLKEAFEGHEPHYPHITAFRMELSNWNTYYLEPKILIREEVPLADIESLGPRGENLPAFLNTLFHKYKKDFESLNLSLKRILPTEPSIKIESFKEGRVGISLSENGSWFSARLISEGTLRVIGLLSAIHPRNPATLVAFEEPENGIHPVRLRLISEVLKNTVETYRKQVIVTTHSPILPEYFDNKNLFICRKDGHETNIEPFASSGPLFKRRDIEHALEDRILRGDFGG